MLRDRVRFVQGPTDRRRVVVRWRHRNQLVVRFARLGQFLDQFILFSLVLESLSDVAVKSLKVTIDLF